MQKHIFNTCKKVYKVSQSHEVKPSSRRRHWQPFQYLGPPRWLRASREAWDLISLTCASKKLNKKPQGVSGHPFAAAGHLVPKLWNSRKLLDHGKQHKTQDLLNYMNLENMFWSSLLCQSCAEVTRCFLSLLSFLVPLGFGFIPQFWFLVWGLHPDDHDQQNEVFCTEVSCLLGRKTVINRKVPGLSQQHRE